MCRPEGSPARSLRPRSRCRGDRPLSKMMLPIQPAGSCATSSRLAALSGLLRSILTTSPVPWLAAYRLPMESNLAAAGNPQPVVTSVIAPVATSKRTMRPSNQRGPYNASPSASTVKSNEFDAQPSSSSRIVRTASVSRLISTMRLIPASKQLATNSRSPSSESASGFALGRPKKLINGSVGPPGGWRNTAPTPGSVQYTVPSAPTVTSSGKRTPSASPIPPMTSPVSGSSLLILLPSTCAVHRLLSASNEIPLVPPTSGAPSTSARLLMPELLPVPDAGAANTTITAAANAAVSATVSVRLISEPPYHIGPPGSSSRGRDPTDAPHGLR